MLKKALGFLIQKISNIGPLRNFIAYIFQRVFNNFIDREITLADFTNGICELNDIPLKVAEINSQFLLLQPYKLHSGQIKHLKISLPNVAQLASESIKIQIQGIHLVLVYNKISKTNVTNLVNEQIRREEEEKLEEEQNKEFQNEFEEEDQQDNFKKLVSNILQNLKYSVNEIIVQIFLQQPDSQSKPQNYIQTQIQQISYEMDETAENTQLIRFTGLSLHVLKELDYQQIKMQSYNDISTIFIQENKEIQIQKINYGPKSNILIKFPQLEMMIDPIQIKIISQFITHTLDFQQTLSSIDQQQRKIRVEELKKREKFQESNQIIEQSIQLSKMDSNDLFKSCYNNSSLNLARSFLTISQIKKSNQKGIVGALCKDFCEEVKEEQYDDEEKEINPKQKNIEFVNEVNNLLKTQQFKDNSSVNPKQETKEFFQNLEQQLKNSQILIEPIHQMEKSIQELKNIDKDILDISLVSIFIYFPIGVSKYDRVWNFEQLKEKYNAKIASTFFCIKFKNINIQISQGFTKFICGGLKIVQIQLSKNSNQKIKILSKDRLQQLEKSNLYQSFGADQSLFQSMDETAFNKFSNKHLNEFNILDQKEHQCYLKILSLKNKKNKKFQSNRDGFCKYNIYDQEQSNEFNNNNEALVLEYSNNTINIELNNFNLYLTPIQVFLDLLSIMYPMEQYKNLLSQTKNFTKKNTSSQPQPQNQQLEPIKINLMIGQIQILISSNQTKSCSCQIIEDEFLRKKVICLKIVIDHFFFNLKLENSLQLIASFESINANLLKFGNNQQYNLNQGFIQQFNFLSILSNFEDEKKYESYFMLQHQTYDSIHMSVSQFYPVITLVFGTLNLNINKQISQTLTALINDLSKFFEIFQKKINVYDKQIMDLNSEYCSNKKVQKPDSQQIDSEHVYLSNSDNELADIPQINVGRTTSIQKIDQIQVQFRVIINKIQLNIELYPKIIQYVPDKIDMEKTYSNLPGVQNLIEKLSQNFDDKKYIVTYSFNNDIQIIISDPILIINILNQIQQEPQFIQIKLGVDSINIEDQNQPDVFLGEFKLTQKTLLYKNSNNQQREKKNNIKIVNKSNFMFGQQDIQDDSLLCLYPFDLKSLIQDPLNSIQFFMNVEILTQKATEFNFQQNNQAQELIQSSIQSPLKVSHQPQDLIQQWKDNDDEDFSEYGDQVEEMNFYDANEVQQEDQDIISYNINIFQSKINDLTLRLGDFKLEFLEKINEIFQEQEQPKKQSPNIILRVQLQLANLCVDIYPVLNFEIRHNYDNPRKPNYEYDQDKLSFSQNRGFLRIKKCDIDIKQEIITLDIDKIQFFLLVFQDLNPNINPINIINHPEDMGFQKIVDILSTQITIGKKQDIFIQFQDDIIIELCKDSLEGLCEFQFILTEILNQQNQNIIQQKQEKYQEDFCIISDTDKVLEKLNFFKQIYNDFSKEGLLEYHNMKFNLTIQIDVPIIKLKVFLGQDFSFIQDSIEIIQESDKINQKQESQNTHSLQNHNLYSNSNEFRLDKIDIRMNYFQKKQHEPKIIKDDKFRHKEESRDKNNYVYLEIKQIFLILSTQQDIIRLTGRIADINLCLTKEKKIDKIFMTETNQLQTGFLLDFLQNQNKIDLLFETPTDIQLNFNLQLKKFIQNFQNIKLEYKKLFRIEDEETEIINMEDIIEQKPRLKNKSRSSQNLNLYDSQLIQSENIFDRHRKEQNQNKNIDSNIQYFSLLYISKMNIFINVDFVIQGILNEGRFNLPEILKYNDLKMETAIQIVSKTYKQQINPELYHNIKNIIGIRNISNIFYGLFGIIQKPIQSYRDLNQIQPGLIDGLNGAYTTIAKEANNAKETIFNISLGVKGVISQNYTKIFKGKWF